MFKATTRHTKFRSPTGESAPFEGFIHEAAPIATHHQDLGYWMVAVPSPHGACLAYGSHIGPYDSEAEAMASGLRMMAREGWRETRQEAEADMAAEINRRQHFRADGKPRVKVLGA